MEPVRARARRRMKPPDAKLADLLDVLQSRTRELAERMLDRYLTLIPSYRALPDETLRQIRSVNLLNITGFIDAMREQRGPTAEELQRVRESAIRRAREGVPLSGLLTAYRVGAQLAWEEARKLIGDDPVLMRVGLDFATAVMHWIDESSGAAAQAYLSEYERLTSDREVARRDFIDGALSGSLTPDEIVARAEAMGLDLQMSHAVALVSFVGAGENDRPTQQRLRTLVGELPSSERSLGVVRGTELVIVFPCDADGGVKMADAIRSLTAREDAESKQLRAGVGRARASLADVVGSYREAQIALSAARATAGSSVALYGDVLVEELILRERGVAKRLARAILEPLEPYPDLRATLREFLVYGPTLPAVAKRLYLHPNTVAYRLGRIRELTGRDPKTPAGVAELFLALRAAELVGMDPA